MKTLVSQAETQIELQKGKTNKNENNIENETNNNDNKDNNNMNDGYLHEFGQDMDITQLQGLSVEQLEALSKFWDSAETVSQLNSEKKPTKQ